nr:MAG TPA: hypothetical protein [Caudoviricetes sp.]DAU41349.1 MAG TPA: hypothetical protein [Bacteriophage sp.]
MNHSLTDVFLTLEYPRVTSSILLTNNLKPM